MEKNKRVDLLSQIVMLTFFTVFWSVLYNLFYNNNIWYEIDSSYIGPDVFYNQKHQLLFKTLLIDLSLYTIVILLEQRLQFIKKINLILFSIFIALIPLTTSVSIIFILLTLFVSTILLYLLNNNNIEYTDLKINSIIFFDFKIILIAILFLFFNIFYYSSSYMHFHSFHWAEMTIFANFWNLDDSLVQFIPRHGLFEVLLQKILFALNFNNTTITHISMFIIKFFSYSDVYLLLIIIFTITKNYFFTFTYFLLYQFIGINPAIHFTPIAITFFILLNINNDKNNKNFFLFLLGFLQVVIYVLRVDIGLFSFTASLITISVVSILKKNIKAILLFILGAFLSLLTMIFLFGYNDFLEFVKITTLLPAGLNDKVWGYIVPTLQNGNLISSKILVSLIFVLVAISFSIREVFTNKNQKIAPYIYLVLIMAASFKILLGRSDFRVFWFSAFLLSLPIAIFFSNNIKVKKIILLSPFLFILILSIPKFDRSFYSQPPVIHALKGFKEIIIGEKKNVKITENDEIKLFSEYKDLIYNNIDKVTFLPFSPYSYVYFNTRPVGRYTDAYQVYPFENNIFYQQLDNSNIVFWLPANLDKIPDTLRLKNYLDYLYLNFDVYIEKEGFIIFKKR